MLIGHIERHGPWWVAICDIIGAFTQGRSKAEAIRNLVEVIELRVDRAGFSADVRELSKQGRHSVRVLVEPSEPAALAAAILRYQRAHHRLSLADVARSLGAASRNAYAAYERGEREPTLGKFRELLGVVAPEVTLILGARTDAFPGSRRRRPRGSKVA
jgi:hypothetical protein